jgi:hypothetical protein
VVVRMDKLVKRIKKWSPRFWWAKIWWFKTTMFFTRKFKVKLPLWSDIEALQAFLNFGKDYVPDKRLDVVRHPTRIYLDKTDNNKVDGPNDCDEHAMFWATNLIKSKLVDRAWYVTYTMGHLNITYEKGRYHKLSGHALCVFEKGGKLFWIDYGNPQVINNFWDYAKESAKIYGAEPIIGRAVEVVRVTKHDRPVLRHYKTHVF